MCSNPLAIADQRQKSIVADEDNGLGLKSIIDIVDVLDCQVKKFPFTYLPSDEIADLKCKLGDITLRLHFMMNSLCPINSLPDEILAAIMEQVVSSIRLCDNPTRAAHDLASICRRWRSVATSSAFLWSKICIGDRKPESSALKSTSAYLIRSKAAPLSIRLDTVSFDNGTSSVMDMLAPHSSRIHTMYLDVACHWPQMFLEQSLPSVENLTVDCSRRNLGPNFAPAFYHEFPRLRQLEISYFTSWNFGIGANLANLTLKNHSWEAKMKFSTFLDLMDGCPVLQELHISRHGPVVDDTGPTRISILSNLRVLDLDFCKSRLILSRLKIPVSTTIYDSMWHLIDTRSHQPYFGPSLTVTNDSSSLELIGSDWSCQLFIGDKEFDKPTLSTIYRSEHGVIKISGEPLPRMKDRWKLFQKLLTSIGADSDVLTTVTGLDLKFDGLIGDIESFHDLTQQWNQALSCVPNLQYLALDDHSPDTLTSFVNALGSTSDTIACHKLHSLWFNLHVTGSLENCSVTSFLTHLTTMVRSRYQNGCPIPELHLLIWRYQNSEHELSIDIKTLKEYGVGKVEVIYKLYGPQLW